MLFGRIISHFRCVIAARKQLETVVKHETTFAIFNFHVRLLHWSFRRAVRGEYRENETL